MTTITLSSRSQHSTGVFEALRNGVVAFIEGVTEGLDMAENYNALSRLSEDELRKRGLTRDAITRAVVLGRGA